MDGDGYRGKDTRPHTVFSAELSLLVNITNRDFKGAEKFENTY
jgi:hypothetical protein